MSNPLRIAIFDLTDCEGCELQFIALREKLLKAGHDFEITNWRLGTDIATQGPFNATFIEGSPITEGDIETVKKARKVSEKIITLGTCAYLGGVQAALPESNREAQLREIYQANYKVKTKAPKPVSYYIDVDIHLPGCPVNPNELEKLLSCLTAGKQFKGAYTPVCLECKENGTPCLFLDEGFCLGVVTRGGCGAPCPAAGLRCYGCFGPMPNANLKALENVAKDKISSKEIDRSLKLFFKNSNEYKNFKSKSKGQK